MLRKLSLLFSVLVLAFAVVACGDDEEEPASGGTETTQPEDSGGSEDTGGGTDVSDNPQVQAAVEQCKQGVQAAAAQLSEDVISDLEGLCDEAATGDAEAVKEATIEVCVKLIEETVPEGPARDQATQQCEAAAGG